MNDLYKLVIYYLFVLFSDNDTPSMQTFIVVIAFGNLSCKDSHLLGVR